jgi:hypothetical protein
MFVWSLNTTADIDTSPGVYLGWMATGLGESLTKA